MRTCAKCGRENIDDTAVQCGFCGEELPEGEGTKKTLFGYVAPAGAEAAAAAANKPEDAEQAPAGGAMDLGKTMLDASPPSFLMEPEEPAAAPAPAPAPAPASASGPAPAPAPAPASASGPAPAPAAAPDSAAAPARSGVTAGYTPTLAAPASLPVGVRTGQGEVQSPATTPAPAPAQSPAVPSQAVAETLMADGAQLNAAQSEPVAPEQSAPPAPATPEPSAQAAADPPATAKPDPTPPLKDESTEVVDSAPAEDLPFNEPGRVLIRVIMALGGLMLIAMFFAPWGGTPDALVFSWDRLKGAGGMDFISHIYLAAGGLVMLAAALIPLPYLLRSLVAVILGLAPLVLARVGHVYWSGWVTIGVLVFLIAALLHRRRYHGSILARILVVFAFLAVVAVNVVPMHGVVPVVGLFKGLSNSGGMGIAILLLPLYLLFIAFLALLMSLKGKSSGGLGGLWALLLLVFLPLEYWLGALAGIIGGAEPLAQLPGLYEGLYTFIFVLVSSYGISQILAKTARKPSPQS